MFVCVCLEILPEMIGQRVFALDTAIFMVKILIPIMVKPMFCSICFMKY